MSGAEQDKKGHIDADGVMRAFSDQLAQDDEAVHWLRRLWEAWGCAPNPNDFKTSVRESMWERMEQWASRQENADARLAAENRALREQIDNARPIPPAARTEQQMSAEQEQVRGVELMCFDCGMTRWVCLRDFEGVCCGKCGHPEQEQVDLWLRDVQRHPDGEVRLHAGGRLVSGTHAASVVALLDELERLRADAADWRRVTERAWERGADAGGCGGCKGIGAHRRHCPRHPSYHPWKRLAELAECVGDSIGEPDLANRAWGLAGVIRERAAERPWRGIGAPVSDARAEVAPVEDVQ